MFWNRIDISRYFQVFSAIKYILVVFPAIITDISAVLPDLPIKPTEIFV